METAVPYSSSPPPSEPKAKNSPPSDRPDLTYREALWYTEQAARYCGRGAIVGVSPDLREICVIPIRCKSWGCSTCLPRLRYKLTNRLQAGKPTKFMTLTIRPEPARTSASEFRTMKKAFVKIVKRIRRKYGEFEYGLVWELTQAGHAHCHIVARCGYIPQAWLSNQWRQFTGAFRVDIRAIDNVKRIAKYVSKYLGKNPASTCQALGGQRLVQFSKHYDPPDGNPLGVIDRYDWQWSWLDTDPWGVLQALPSDFAAAPFTIDKFGVVTAVLEKNRAPPATIEMTSRDFQIAFAPRPSDQRGDEDADQHVPALAAPAHAQTAHE